MGTTKITSLRTVTVTTISGDINQCLQEYFSSFINGKERALFKAKISLNDTELHKSSKKVFNKAARFLF